MKRTRQIIIPPEIRGARFLSPVRLAGHHAGGALKSGSRWELLAVFPGGIYCQNQSDGIVFLCRLSGGAGPLNALCEIPEGWNWQREGLHSATPVYSDGQTLWVDGRFGFSFEDAHPWQKADPSGKWDLQAMSERIPLLVREAARREHPDGFGPLISRFSEMVREPLCAPNPLIRTAWPGIQSLFHWLEDRFASGSQGFPARIDENGVKGLIGLGPGLTPSGDDLLGGCMIALHSLGRKDMAEELGRMVLREARTRTGTISRAHLACAAQGEGSEALHDTILALGVENDHCLIRCLDKIGTIGATSGWDAVAGVFLVMKALLGRDLSRSVRMDQSWRSS